MGSGLPVRNKGFTTLAPAIGLVVMKKLAGFLFGVVPYKAGTIRAAGYNKDKQVAAFELKTAGKPARIRLSANRDQIAADGQDLSHVTIELVDDKGVVVPNADLAVKIEVAGDGRLLGLDNGDLRAETFFTGNPVKTYFGRALATIQAGRSKGKITVKAVSGNLPAAILTLTCN